MYRLNTSRQTTHISRTISQANALPTQVLIPSIVWRTPWTFIYDRSPAAERLGNDKAPSRRPTEWCFATSNEPSNRLLCVRSEIVVERHLAVDHRVLLPLYGPFGESELRLDDFLEQRIIARFRLGHVVED